MTTGEVGGEGDRHMVVLNTNCTVVDGGCGADSPRLAWLKQDLADNPSRCILAYGHHPRWSNGIAGPMTDTETAARGYTELHVAPRHARRVR